MLITRNILVSEGQMVASLDNFIENYSSCTIFTIKYIFLTSEIMVQVLLLTSVQCQSDQSSLPAIYCLQYHTP